MRPEIRFCTRPDGVRIAYSLTGEGPPLIAVYPWNHCELAEESPIAAQGRLATIKRTQTFIQFDRHGTGLSDRERTDFSLDADVLDLEAISDHLDLAEFVLFGIGIGGAIALAYTARHPSRVTDLILWRSYARGGLQAPTEVRQAIVNMLDAHWGAASRQMAALMAPHGDAEFLEYLARFNREAVTAGAARRILEASYEHDLTELAPQVHARTLIVNWKRDPFTPFAAGRELASLIPGAQFVPIEGAPRDSNDSLDLVIDFLGTAAPSGTGAPVTVFVTDRERSTDLTQRLGDEPAHELQRAHDQVVRKALGLHGGREIKHLGDGIMATFTSPSAAIACAIDVQRELETRDDVRVRIGLAAGEVVIEGGDIFGSTVQLASRVCARADGGQILVPEAVRQLAGSKGFVFGRARSVALKGMPERVRIYEVDWRG